jgi:hypothetical protein
MVYTIYVYVVTKAMYTVVKQYIDSYMVWVEVVAWHTTCYTLPTDGLTEAAVHPTTTVSCLQGELSHPHITWPFPFWCQQQTISTLTSTSTTNHQRLNNNNRATTERQRARARARARATAAATTTTTTTTTTTGAQDTSASQASGIFFFLP